MIKNHVFFAITGFLLQLAFYDTLTTDRKSEYFGASFNSLALTIPETSSKLQDIRKEVPQDDVILKYYTILGISNKNSVSIGSEPNFREKPPQNGTPYYLSFLSREAIKAPS